MPEVVSALLIVVGGIVLLRVALGFAGLVPRAGARRRLRVVETCSLGGRQRLHLVDVEGERLLVGASEASVSLLRRVGPAESREASAPAERPPGRLGHAAARGLRLLRGAAPLVLLGLCLPRLAFAAPPDSLLPQLAEALAGAGEPEQVSTSLQIVALVTLVSVAPSILLMGTCFTRVVIVLSFLRQAIGIQQLPPNQVLVGLALFVTLFVMAPVGERIRVEALTPYINQEIGPADATTRALVPVREFLGQFTREKDLALFTSLAGDAPPADLADVPLSTLVPAYLLSELRTAFEIGFTIYLPFLVVDLVISSMLISMGMIVLPPIVVSLPFKLMLFVLLDGWNLVVASLVTALR